jgi:hypothetical protein
VPKSNPATSEIPNLYKRQAVHLLLYGFMTGVQWSVPSITKRESAQAFLKRYDLEEQYSIDDLLNTYNRIHKDFIDAQKTK